MKSEQEWIRGEQLAPFHALLPLKHHPTVTHITLQGGIDYTVQDKEYTEIVVALVSEKKRR